MKTNKPDTKAKIFDVSLRLFAEKGYENVSMRNIADNVGIKAPSIYNHYSTKDEILSECYSFYLKYRHVTRLTREQYEPIIRHGAKEDLLKVLIYKYPDDVVENMVYCLFEVFSRLYSDERARDIFKEDTENSMNYISGVFKFGIEIGRFDKFNIHTVAMLFVCAGICLAQSGAIRPREMYSLSKLQLDMHNELLTLIPFKY